MGLSVYVLVAILKKQLGLDLSLHQIPQILSVTVFEKTLNSRGVFQLQRRDHRYRALHPVESIRLLMGQHWVFTTKHHDGFCMFDTSSQTTRPRLLPMGRTLSGNRRTFAK